MENLKHIIRDKLIWASVYTGVVSLRNFFLRREGPLVRILSLHDITDAIWFDSLISELKHNYKILTPNEFHSKHFVSDRINVLLTFDDGYQSWVDIVMPILNTYDVKATFFVSSGLLDATEAGEEAVVCFVRDRLKLTTSRQLIDWEGVRELLMAGHTLGGHTATHASLRQLSEDEVEHEVVEDKRMLESRLETTITDFAYPFGRKEDMSHGTDRQINDSGYTYLYSAYSGFYQAKKYPMTSPIPRTLLENNQSLSSVNYWIKGGYDIVSVK